MHESYPKTHLPPITNHNAPSILLKRQSRNEPNSRELSAGLHTVMDPSELLSSSSPSSLLHPSPWYLVSRLFCEVFLTRYLPGWQCAVDLILGFVAWQLQRGDRGWVPKRLTRLKRLRVISKSSSSSAEAFEVRSGRRSL
jgi:hypothetical protein